MDAFESEETHFFVSNNSSSSSCAAAAAALEESAQGCHVDSSALLPRKREVALAVKGVNSIWQAFKWRWTTIRLS
jgi:hypothetical protein